MSLLTIPMGFAHDTVTLSLLAVLPGLVCAPTLSAASARSRASRAWRCRRPAAAGAPPDPDGARRRVGTWRRAPSGVK
ncbi:hypothetical protein [Sinomonas mesophila]|uniref:hypothetical protein n=1 Tax=Sinomonas mesophila TaxID=1531955 RepID=UPI001589B886|nr:hypothetical protein [Sinomonas mesophila]